MLFVFVILVTTFCNNIPLPLTPPPPLTPANTQSQGERVGCLEEGVLGERLVVNGKSARRATVAVKINSFGTHKYPSVLRPPTCVYL